MRLWRIYVRACDAYTRQALSPTPTCKRPCTQTTYEVQSTHEVEYPTSCIGLNFESPIDVTQTEFRTKFVTLLTGLGGAVSRTWFFFILSIFQSKSHEKHGWFNYIYIGEGEQWTDLALGWPRYSHCFSGTFANLIILKYLVFVFILYWLTLTSLQYEKTVPFCCWHTLFSGIETAHKWLGDSYNILNQCCINRNIVSKCTKGRQN